MQNNEKTFGELLDDTREITRRFGVGVREALLDHKKAGNSIAIWRDGKVVIVPPEEIVFDEPQTAPKRKDV